MFSSAKCDRYSAAALLFPELFRFVWHRRYFGSSIYNRHISSFFGMGDRLRPSPCRLTTMISAAVLQLPLIQGSSALGWLCDSETVVNLAPVAVDFVVTVLLA